MASGRGRVVYITGEAGVGKSRLIAEFLARVHGDVRVCASQSSPYGAFGYGPLADLVADLAGIEADTTSDIRKIRLAALTGKSAGWRMPDEDALNTLLDVDSSRSPLRALPPLDRRLRVEAAAIALLSSISKEKPLILLIEDLHWLNKDGRAQVARICDGLKNERCLVLLSVRDGWEGASDLGDQSDYQCHLAPLEPVDAAQMVGALVRSGRGTATLSREIVERTRGNPLFVEETLRALHQLGALVREGNIYSLLQRGVDVPLSPTYVDSWHRASID